MSDPTAGEWKLAAELNLDAAAVAAARDALNIIVSLPWPRPERLSLLLRLAREAGTDIGEVLGGLALDVAPIVSFDALVAVPGLGREHVPVLARALSAVDFATLMPNAGELEEMRAMIGALRDQNQALRAEVDRLRAAAPAEGGGVMRIADVAASLGNQIATVDQFLRSRPDGVRLNAVDLRITGTGTASGGELAIDLGSPAGGSAIGISFVPGRPEAAPGPSALVPDVRGYTTALAERKLTARGFSVAFTSFAGTGGIVTDQSPAPGALGRSSSVVRLIVRDPREAAT